MLKKGGTKNKELVYNYVVKEFTFINLKVGRENSQWECNVFVCEVNLYNSHEKLTLSLS